MTVPIASLMGTYITGYGYYLVFVLPAIIFSLAMSALVKSTYSKYSRVRNRRGITGAQAAETILRLNGITDVRVVPIEGTLTDNYNPRTHTVSLSRDVYDSSSVAAVGIAAHEVGHVCQHYKNYVGITLRNMLLPVANIGSSLSVPLVVLGIVLNFGILIDIGIWVFLAVVLFQLVTLPVEINASSRAKKSLVENNILDEAELSGTKKVLNAAAMTYVAALAVSLAQLLRLVFMSRNRR